MRYKIAIKPLDIALEALYFGSEPKNPILAFHGWQDNAASFVPLAKLLPQLNICAIDFLGHGHSPHLSRASSYHLIDWALSIIHIADSLGIKKIRVLAHSMGAALTSVAAAIFPDRFEKIFLIEAIAPIAHDVNHFIDRSQKVFASRLKNSGVSKRDLTLDEAALSRQLAGDMTLENARLIAKRNLKRNTTGKYSWRFDPRIRLPYGSFSEEQVQYLLKTLSCPTRVVYGVQGLQFAKNQVLLAKTLNKKNIEFIECFGRHHLHMDHPEKIAPLITDFFT